MPHTPEQISPSRLVSTGLIQAASDLKLSGSNLARILGLSEATVSRLKNGTWTLQKDSKSYEIAMVFLHVYQRLKSVMNGNSHRMRAWLHARNEDLGSSPVSLLNKLQGLFQVLFYLQRPPARID
jgi:hypothetical protein